MPRHTTSQRLEGGLEPCIVSGQLLERGQLNGREVQTTGGGSASFEPLLHPLSRQSQIGIAHRLRQKALLERPHQGLSPNVDLRRINHTDGQRGI